MVGLTWASLTNTAEKLMSTAPVATITAPDVSVLFNSDLSIKGEKIVFVRNVSGARLFHDQIQRSP